MQSGQDWRREIRAIRAAFRQQKRHQLRKLSHGCPVNDRPTLSLRCEELRALQNGQVGRYRVLWLFKLGRYFADTQAVRLMTHKQTYDLQARGLRQRRESGKSF